MPKSRKAFGLRQPSGFRERPTAAQRRAVEARANGVCEYCRILKSFVPEPFNVEHIIPVAQGGKTEIRNLAWACAGCNYYKHDKVKAVDPQTNQKVQLFNPRRQRWEEQFAWDKSAKLLIGLTAAGRATVQALRLNREELINLRWALGELGLHPPILGSQK
ncbi:MAG: HNH endonuclease signature motif containing protein [Acidobacteriota bacterium]|nr:HNH endonuclease signature motif containing protein [Acidobacteriota bacterium]